MLSNKLQYPKRGILTDTALKSLIYISGLKRTIYFLIKMKTLEFSERETVLFSLNKITNWQIQLKKLN